MRKIRVRNELADGDIDSVRIQYGIGTDLMDAAVRLDVMVAEGDENDVVGEAVAGLERHVANVERQSRVDDGRGREVQHGLDRRLLAVEEQGAILDDDAVVADACVVEGGVDGEIGGLRTKRDDGGERLVLRQVDDGQLVFLAEVADVGEFR